MEDQKRQRTCVACSKKLHQSALVRLTQGSNGRVVLDPRCKSAGRGAYVCSESCLVDALSTGRLARVLRTKIERIEHNDIISDFRDMMCEKDR